MTRKQRARYTRKCFERAAYICFNTSLECVKAPKKDLRRLREVMLEEAQWQEQRVLEGKA